MDLIDRDALLKSMGLTDAVKYGNKDAEQQYRSYSTWMSYEIADAILDAPAVNRWISVEDALPEKSGEYLVYTEYEDVFKCYFEKENDPEEDECQWGFYQDYRDPDTLGWAGETWTAVETVTHWMPLPEPPKE